MWLRASSGDGYGADSELRKPNPTCGIAASPYEDSLHVFGVGCSFDVGRKIAHLKVEPLDGQRMASPPASKEIWWTS